MITDDIERMMRGQLEQMDADARTLRADGHVKLAERCEREAARARRRLERALAGMPARRAAADARAGEMLCDVIAELDRRLAAGGAHE